MVMNITLKNIRKVLSCFSMTYDVRFTDSNKTRIGVMPMENPETSILSSVFIDKMLENFSKNLTYYIDVYENRPRFYIILEEK